MRKQIGFVALCAWALVPGSALAEQPPGEKSVALAFSARDVGGHTVGLSDFRDKKAVVVIFTGTQCPVSNYYVPRLKELSKTYAAKGVQFLAVNGNPQDTL